MEEVINHFKHIMLPKAALTVALNQCIIHILTLIEETPNPDFYTMKRSMTQIYERLLSE